MGILPITYPRKMTLEQFIEWAKRMDTDNDGKISKEELKQALRALGLRNTRWKAWRAMVHADLNHNRHIDGNMEMEELAKYAKKRWGITIDGP